MPKVLSSVGAARARRLTQGQSIAEAAHLAQQQERERCLAICVGVLNGLTNGGARNAAKCIWQKIRAGDEECQ